MSENPRSFGSARLALAALLFACGPVFADGFRDAMMSVPVEPSAQEQAAFNAAVQGTWAADHKTRAEHPVHLDFIDERFLLVPYDKTSLKPGGGAATMLGGWRIEDVQRVPIDGWTRERYAEVQAEDSRWYREKGERRPIDIGASFLLRHAGTEWSQRVLEQAVAEGVSEVWTAELTIERPRALAFDFDTQRAVRGWEGVDTGYMWVLVAGDRLYVGAKRGDENPLLAYRRRSSLGTDAPAEFDRNRRGHLLREHEEWHARCSQLRSAKVEPAFIQTCETFRDRYVALGLEPIDDSKRFRSADTLVQTEAETAFWKAYSEPTVDEHQPYLDYCFVNVSGQEYKAAYAALRARNFERTAWRLQVTLLEKETSLDRAAFLERTHELMGWQRELWLREDGVLGVQSRFDEANRWSVQDEALLLQFGDLTLSAPIGPSSFPIVDNKASSHVGYYNLKLIGSNYELYQQRSVTPDHPNYAALVQEVTTGQCSNAGLLAQAAKSSPSTQAAAAAAGATTASRSHQTTQTAPTRPTEAATRRADAATKRREPQTQSQESGTSSGAAAQRPNRPAASPPRTTQPQPLPSYWHMRVEPADAKVQVAPAIRQFWDKGVYVFLNEDGRVGFNTDNPGPYFYQGVKKWKQQGRRLTIDLDGLPYTFDLPGSFESTITTLDDRSQEFKMLLYPKTEGGR